MRHGRINGHSIILASHPQPFPLNLEIATQTESCAGPLRHLTMPRREFDASRRSLPAALAIASSDNCMVRHCDKQPSRSPAILVPSCMTTFSQPMLALHRSAPERDP